MNYLEENLKRIAIGNPDIELLRNRYRPDYPEIKTAKDGSPVPVINKKSLHSSYNPASEAQKWVQNLGIEFNKDTLYVIGGLGFTYHLSELLKIVPAEQLVVIEKDTALAASALANRPSDVFPQGLRFIVGQTAARAHARLNEINRNNHDIVFLDHPASNNIYPDYYSAIKGIIRVQKTEKYGGYKVLLVSPMYGGSLPVTYCVQRALNSIGHRCELLDNTSFYPGFKHIQEVTTHKQHQNALNSMLTSLLAETVTARAVETQADLVLVIAQGPATAEVIEELRKADIRTAFWFVEDGSTLQYWKGIAPLFDGFFVIQKGEFFTQLKDAGCQHPYYLPMAADPAIHRPLELTPEEIAEFGSDLSHVGAGYHNRRDFFAGLLDFDFKIWGSDWEKAGPLSHIIQRDGERIPTEDTIKIFNASKINVNLHSSTYHSGVNPFGDFLNPRTYEIAACGAFQLVDERRYLAENFEVGTEVVTFNSLQDMRDLAREYLEKPEERAEIAAASRQRVLKEHTFEHRLRELMGVIAGRYPEWKPKGGGLPTAEELIRAAGEDSEMVAVMERFIGKGPLTLEDVAADIEKGEGEFTRTEAMILLLNEFRRWGLEKGVM